MDFLGGLLLTLFVAMVLVLAFLFGTAILLATIVTSAIFAAAFLIRAALVRWNFIRRAERSERGVIEVEYHEVKGDRD